MTGKSAEILVQLRDQVNFLVFIQEIHAVPYPNISVAKVAKVPS